MTASAQQVTLALLDAATSGRTPRALDVKVLVSAGQVLGVQPGAMRVALTRLAARKEVVAEARGRWRTGDRRAAVVKHVRQFSAGGFAARGPWRGGFIGVLTSDLERSDARQVRVRERALTLTGLRPLSHGLWARPDNLEGGRAAVETHLRSLGLERQALVVEVRLAPGDASLLQRRYELAKEAKDTARLLQAIARFETSLTSRPVRQVAAESFWLGDEVLRFLARDPLLPSEWLDERPRAALAAAMTRFDRRARQIWSTLLEEFSA